MSGINTTGNPDIDQATAEIAVYLRDVSPGKRDQVYYDEAMRLRDAIMGVKAKSARVLTERRKADRAAMAGQVAELARSHGLAAAVVTEKPGTRETRTVLSGPHGLRLTVAFCGRSPHPRPDTYVLSWHGVDDGYRLNPDVFGNVNPYHGAKATDVAYDFNALVTKLARRFAAVSDGSALIAAS